MRAPEKLVLGLLHYPVYDRQKKVVATNITNFDVHDIARAARTYGINLYYVIHPSREQLMFVMRMKDHWTTGYGFRYNSLRCEALRTVRVAESYEAALTELAEEYRLVITSAHPAPGAQQIGFKTLRGRLWDEGNSEKYFLVFGTGYGLTEDFKSLAPYALEPILGQDPQNFRHLSVRSAVSICLDRLLGTW